MAQTLSQHTGTNGKPLPQLEMWCKFKKGSKFKDMTYSGYETLRFYQSFPGCIIASEIAAFEKKLENIHARVTEAFIYDNTGPEKRLQVAHWKGGKWGENLLGL